MFLSVNIKILYESLNLSIHHQHIAGGTDDIFYHFK